jgi:uncharacterized membrane protein YphA (DoxX/SURF4 family)
MTASATFATGAGRPTKGWNIGLWIGQVLLALPFGLAGVMKTFTPIDELGQKIPWVSELPNLVRFIGISELLGAIGLILPAATRVRPVLTPLAAVGLAVVMVLAAGFHVLRGELHALPVNVVLGGLAVFVAWGRFRKVPIEPRK